MRRDLLTRFVKVTLGFAILAFAVDVSAHTGHKKKQEPQTKPLQTIVTTEPVQDVEKSPEPEEMQAMEVNRDQKEIMKEAITSHLHNKIVHFPLALGLAGALLILLGYKWPQYQSASRVLLLLAAMLAIAAYFTGRAQEEPFEKGEMAPFLEAHKNQGITTAVMLWIGVFLTGFSQYKKLLALYAIVLLLLISLTGFFGGILAHG